MLTNTRNLRVEFDEVASDLLNLIEKIPEQNLNCARLPAWTA